MADVSTNAVATPGADKDAAAREAELIKLAYTDDLTGLYNRRYFSKYLKQDCDFTDGAAPLALCIMDLDFLKRINDRLGHLVGDAVLKRIGQLMRAGVREGDIPVRYAGDEFALVCPGKSREEAIEIADKLRLAIQNDPFEEAGLPEGLHPSLSVGVAWFPEDAKQGEELVDRADKALYFSKRTGKNRVTSAADIEGQSEVADLDSLSGFPSKTVVGREDAFHAIGDAVDLVSDGRNAFVLIEGDAGIGKTRFLSELVRYSRERELTCLLEKCSPVGREQPYKAIAGLLDRYFRAEPSALALVAKALDDEKRRALGDIVPAVREYETTSTAANAAAAIKAAGLEAKPGLDTKTPGPQGPPPVTRPGAPAHGGAVVKRPPPPRPPAPGAGPAGEKPGPAPPAWQTVGAAPPSSTPGPTPPARPASGRSEPGSASGARPPRPVGSSSGVREAGTPSRGQTRQPGEPGKGAPGDPPTQTVRGLGEPGKGAPGDPPTPTIRGLGEPGRGAPGDAPTATVRFTTLGADGRATGPRPVGPPGPAPRPAAPGPHATDRHPTSVLRGAAPAGKRASERVTPASGPVKAPATDPHPTRRNLVPPPPEAGDGPVAFASTADEAVASASRSTKSVNVFMSVCQALAALSQLKPVLIIWDDMEHADEATLEVVARALPQDGRILFCGSAKVDAAAGREGELDAPYTAFHDSLGDFPNVFKIELGALGRDHTAELAQHLLQGFKLPLPILDRLLSVSKGNPLFIEGALRFLVTSGVLVKAEGGWKVAKEAPETIPLTLEDLVRGQLSVLDKETAELLADAAVIGPNFDFEVLRTVGGKNRSEGEALDLVEAARRARIIRDTGGEGGDFAFASNVVADVTYKGLDEERKKTTHKRVAELKERAGRADAGELAYHYRRAGEKEKAERFEAALRERSEQIFDREAIEQLDDEVKQPRIPEVRDPPLAALWKEIPPLAKALVAAARASKPAPTLPKPELEKAEKLAAETREALLKVLGKCFEAVPAFTISHRGNSLLLNGEHPHQLHGEGPSAEALAGMLRVNSVKSITFLKSPSEDEIVNETTAILLELGTRTIQTPLERHFWWRFCIEKDLRRISVVQKIPVLKKRQIARKGRKVVRIAERDLPRVREFIWNLATALDVSKKQTQGSAPVADALAALDRTLRFLLSMAPAVAINAWDGGLVVNGTPLSTGTIRQGGAEVLELLKATKLRGFCLLSDISHQELFRFVDRIAKLGPKDVEGDRDPGREISSDGSFPNILVGDAMFKMAAAALGPDGKPEGAEDAGAGAEPTAEGDEPSRVADELATDTAGLPAGFTWPSDAVAKRARALAELAPEELISKAKQEDVVSILEALLLDGRETIARRVWERCAIAFTSGVAETRRGAAELFQELSRRGTAELRGRFSRVAVRRLADALEIETDVDIFEQLVRAARAAALERIGDADWDTAARLVYGISRRREASVGAGQALQKIAREALAEIIRDPRIERLYETLETGTVQDRRRAVRVFEGMGTVAVQPLVDALKRTGRGRVETFLIDVLAGLIPDSEQAIQREITPYAPPQSVMRLLRAASVVCRDATQVLLTALQNPDPAVRVEAVSIARSVGGSLAQSVLRWAVKHAAVEAQLAAVSGLGELARGDAVESVIELLETTETVEVQRECCLALGKLQTERAVPLLARLLRPGGLLRKEEHEDVRHASAWALGQMRQNDEARKALERALEDKNKNVRLAAKAFLEGRA